ncbi:MAG: hypothetical protein QMD09_09775 [Desulfatibacillaceae bacterium]|nr:hypothetical protein [Desulfatibacillaceae bacterium]
MVQPGCFLKAFSEKQRQQSKKSPVFSFSAAGGFKFNLYAKVAVKATFANTVAAHCNWVLITVIGNKGA